MTTYKIITLTKTDARQIDMCNDCGTLVLSRTLHDAWHALVDRAVDQWYDDAVAEVNAVLVALHLMQTL